MNITVPKPCLVKSTGGFDRTAFVEFLFFEHSEERSAVYQGRGVSATLASVYGSGGLQPAALRDWKIRPAAIGRRDLHLLCMKKITRQSTLRADGRTAQSLPAHY